MIIKYNNFTLSCIIGVNNKVEKPNVDLVKVSERSSFTNEVRLNNKYPEMSSVEIIPRKKEAPVLQTLNIRQTELMAVQMEQEKKRKALEEAKKLLGASNSIEIVPIKRGRKPEVEHIKIPTHEPIVSNVEALIQNDESNDELSEPPTVALPMFEELANKNGTGIRRKIGKGDYMNFLLLYKVPVLAQFFKVLFG